MHKLMLAWQNPKTRKWIPAGVLCASDDSFIFRYTKDVKQVESFVPFGQMNDLDMTYKSETLFPLFSNRLLSKTRPEYDDYLEWLGLDKEHTSPILELSKSGGIRATDSLQLFPIPEKKNGFYEVEFFSHGIRHLPASYIERVKHLRAGEQLFLMKDVQNKYDPLALAIRTDDAPEIVGYCPSFFVEDFSKLISLTADPKTISVSVAKVNIEAPIQYRLLCKLKVVWPENFAPFGGAYECKK